MVDKKMSMSLVSLVMLGFVVFSCSKEVSSKPNFIFKVGTDKNVAGKFGTNTITQKELAKGIETEIYEAEMKVYELKLNKLKSIVLEKLVESHPDKKSLTNDEFMDKFIAANVKVSKKEMDAFIVERKIPKEHLNDQMKERVNQFLLIEKKKNAIEAWLTAQTAQKPVEIYLIKPIRPTFKVNIDSSNPSFGSESAKVTIVEFSDFQCPFCAKGADLLKQVKKKYGTKVRVVFKNYPLPFHNDAKGAAMAGLCANEQGSNKFWKLHDEMFAHQDKLAIDGLKAMAKKIKLDSKKFDACLTSSKYTASIEKDLKDGQEVSVRSTPTFFVNGQIVSGAIPFKEFSELIDSELKK